MSIDTTIRPAGLAKSRIEALSDGVFSIAMTLLVLDVRVPAPSEVAAAGGLAPALLGLWPRLLTYALSFGLLGVYWVGHHVTFHFIKRTNRTLLWINIAFLLCVASMPFTTALVAQYHQDPTALAAYGGALILTGLALESHWWYATSGHRLVDRDLDPRVITYGSRRILFAPAMYLTSIVVAFLSPAASLLIFVIVPILYIVPEQSGWLFSPPASGREAR